MSVKSRYLFVRPEMESTDLTDQTDPTDLTCFSGGEDRFPDPEVFRPRDFDIFPAAFHNRDAVAQPLHQLSVIRCLIVGNVRLAMRRL